MKYHQEYVKTIIPHRDPMLLVTTVEELEEERRIITTFYVDPSREIFQGHFPEEPVLPGVYTVECMAQAADRPLCRKSSPLPWNQQCPVFAENPAGRYH